MYTICSVLWMSSGLCIISVCYILTHAHKHQCRVRVGWHFTLVKTYSSSKFACFGFAWCLTVYVYGISCFSPSLSLLVSVSPCLSHCLWHFLSLSIYIYIWIYMNALQLFLHFIEYFSCIKYIVQKRSLDSSEFGLTIKSSLFQVIARQNQTQITTPHWNGMM